MFAKIYAALGIDSELSIHVWHIDKLNAHDSDNFVFHFLDLSENAFFVAIELALDVIEHFIKEFVRDEVSIVKASADTLLRIIAFDYRLLVGVLLL